MTTTNEVAPADAGLEYADPFADVRQWLESLPADEYPADLLAARRAEFVAQIAAANDPDRVDGESCVSEADDWRNSRPFPY